MAGVDDTAIEKQNWHWRNTGRPVRFFSLDARAAIPYAVLLVYARPITFIIVIITTMVFRFVEKKGLTFWAALRAFRVWLFGYGRPGYFSYHRRVFRIYRE